MLNVSSDTVVQANISENGVLSFEQKKETG